MIAPSRKGLTSRTKRVIEMTASERKSCRSIGSLGCIVSRHLRMMDGVKYRELLQRLRADGWRHVRTTGSHMMFEHPQKAGPVVVPAGGKEGQDLPQGTLNSILKQAR